MLSSKIKSKKTSLNNQNTGYYFLIPWLIGLVSLQIYPFAASLYYSFTDYSIVRSHSFIGLSNYITMLTSDSLFRKALKVTSIYVIFTVPLKLSFALFIAILLNLRVRFINAFRTIYYLPSILGASVGIAILWRFLFNNQGYINVLLSKINIGPINFIGSPDLAIYTISSLAVWQYGSAMILFLAALQQVPQELVEAAKIDGAGRIRVFRSITFPMITPILFFNLIMQTINAFQEFTSPFLITGGGPIHSTYLYGLMLYENAFSYLKMGYASAQSWFLFIVILIFTLLVFKSSTYWTHYQDGDDF